MLFCIPVVLIDINIYYMFSQLKFLLTYRACVVSSPGGGGGGYTVICILLLRLDKDISSSISANYTQTDKATSRRLPFELLIAHPIVPSSATNVEFINY